VWKEKLVTNFRLERSPSNLNVQQHVPQDHQERKVQWDHLDLKVSEVREVKLVSMDLQVKLADKVFQGCPVIWVDQAHRGLQVFVAHLGRKD